MIGKLVQFGIGVAAASTALPLTASNAVAQDGEWCRANPVRCERLKARIRVRCQQDRVWCARFRERIRQRRMPHRVQTQGLVRATITHDGRQRQFWWFTPARVRKAPLVVVLHGGGGRPRQMAAYTGFTTQARRSGFSVLYPAGLNRHWNDGRRENRSVNTDDVGFLRRAIGQVVRQGRVDRRRIFVTGISNGGFMSLRMACDASDLVAGIAAVTAQFSTVLAERCKPSRSVPVMLMNGTADTLVPYRGGVVAPRFGGRGYVQHTDATIRFWVRRNGCPPQAAIRPVPDRNRLDGVTMFLSVWRNCRSGSPVVLYKLVNGGHTWPGKRPYLPERIIGKTGQDIDGTRAIWHFFRSLPPR